MMLGVPAEHLSFIPKLYREIYTLFNEIDLTKYRLDSTAIFRYSHNYHISSKQEKNTKYVSMFTSHLIVSISN